ncbi:MAG: hypothetical protein ACM359_06275 [Bacillota bacterium]
MGLVVLLIGVLAARTMATERSDVLAHAMGRADSKGADISIALIESENGSADKTTVLHREVYRDTHWRDLGLVPARVIALTDNGNELVLLLQNGSWVWFSYPAEPTSSFRFSYGPALPAGAKVVALAGDSKSLWALGNRPESPNRDGAQPPTTQPVGLRVFRLSGGDWDERPASWPEASCPRQLLSMQVIADEPHVAVWTPGTSSIRIYKLGKDAQEWSKVGEMLLEQTPRRMKLLTIERSPAVWCQGENTLGQIWMHGRWVPLASTEAQPEPNKLDVTVAGDQIRVLYRRQKGLVEQRYTTSGARDGEPTPVVYTSQRSVTMSNWLGTAVMALVAMLIAGSLLRKRGSVSEEDQQSRDE